MKDFFGETLHVGSKVAFTSYEGSGLGKGVVIKITEKMVRIRYGYGSEILRLPQYVVKYLGNNFDE